MSPARRYGVIFFGLGLTANGPWGGTERTGTGHVNVSALLCLVAPLNAITRFTARRMRLQGDVSGADNLMSWQTGYPFGVDFSRGYPRYNPGEFTANDLLQRGDVDAALLVGEETVQYFSPRAIEHLRSIPTIVIDYPGTEPFLTPNLRFTTAVYGLHSTGTAYRMDNVPITLRELLSTSLPTDEAILKQLLQHCRESVTATDL